MRPVPTIEIARNEADVVREVRLAKSQPKVTIVVHEHAAGVVHAYMGDIAAPGIVVTVGPYAHLTLLCTSTSTAAQHITEHIQVNVGAKFHAIIVTCGSAYGHDVYSEIRGEHGQSSIDCVFLAHEKDRQRIKVQNSFLAPQGGGEITVRGVAKGKAHVSVDGKIEIGPQGTGTSTHLTQHVLMLDPTAKIDAIPALEIHCNDVKASHSATVSKVNEEDLFYASSRGIDITKARDLLVKGFLDELVTRMPKSIRAAAENALYERYM